MSKKKCARCVGNELYERYHDEERGVPVTDDRKLFEFLILEGAQAGLSWITILQRRESYSEAFDDWDVEKIAQYDEDKIQALIVDARIIRNKLKIRSAVKNAQVFLAIQKEYSSFSDYLRSFVDHEQIVNRWKSLDECPTSTPLSHMISKDLKKRGMSFVGPTIIYAYLQAVGVVNDHVVDCWRYTL